MDNLKELANEEVVKLVKDKKVGARELTDSGICPTCFDKENDNVLYGKTDNILYEDDQIYALLVGNPRAEGHAAVFSKKHFKDMMSLDDELCSHVFLVSKKLMNVIKEVYGSESVYICSMCDGPMNHFHAQLIPRYSDEKRGSKNFVKERKEYVEDMDKIIKIRSLMKK